MKRACVFGAGGFIGSHMVKRLKSEGYHVTGVDLKKPEYFDSPADWYMCRDLRNPSEVENILCNGDFAYDLLIQMAADMGGAGYIFTGENDANVMHNSVMINANTAFYARKCRVGKVFFSSSACVYPQEIQQNEDNSGLREIDAYPVNPDSEYGYEKIFSERLYDSFRRNYDLKIAIARFHNIFGEEGTYKGGREKAPAALCRKVAEAKDGDAIEIWGDGRQTRSFLYIDECVEGVMRLINSEIYAPINIGSSERVSINDLAHMIIGFSGKRLSVKNIEGPQGVRGRNSDNTQIQAALGWAPIKPLEEGIEKLYHWINKQVNG